MMDKNEIIERLERLARCAVHTVGELPFVMSLDDGIAIHEAIDMLRSQPERKKGKWIAVTEDGDVYKRICSCCGQEAFFQNDDPDELYDGGRYELSDFCPHCGAYMREVDDGQV